MILVSVSEPGAVHGVRYFSLSGHAAYACMYTRVRQDITYYGPYDTFCASVQISDV